jgi:hypothetical protein
VQKGNEKNVSYMRDSIQDHSTGQQETSIHLITDLIWLSCLYERFVGILPNAAYEARQTSDGSNETAQELLVETNKSNKAPTNKSNKPPKGKLQQQL